MSRPDADPCEIRTLADDEIIHDLRARLKALEAAIAASGLDRAGQGVRSPEAPGVLLAQDEAVRWRHRKRATVYLEIGRGELQASGGMLAEGAEVVIYRGADGRFWVRAVPEFEDGRFERVVDDVR